MIQTHASCDDHGPPRCAGGRAGRRREEVVRMAQVTIATGFDVDYYLDQVGADYYLSAAGEPPGIWAGSAAPGLGLAGEVDPDVMRALYHHDTAPDGTPLTASQRGPKYQGKRTYQQVQEAIDK